MLVLTVFVSKVLCDWETFYPGTTTPSIISGDNPSLSINGNFYIKSSTFSSHSSTLIRASSSGSSGLIEDTFINSVTNNNNQGGAFYIQNMNIAFSNVCAYATKAANNQIEAGHFIYWDGQNYVFKFISSSVAEITDQQNGGTFALKARTDLGKQIMITTANLSNINVYRASAFNFLGSPEIRLCTIANCVAIDTQIIRFQQGNTQLYVTLFNFINNAYYGTNYEPCMFYQRSASTVFKDCVFTLASGSQTILFDTSVAITLLRCYVQSSFSTSNINVESEIVTETKYLIAYPLLGGLCKNEDIVGQIPDYADPTEETFIPAKTPTPSASPSPTASPSISASPSPSVSPSSSPSPSLSVSLSQSPLFTQSPLFSPSHLLSPSQSLSLSSPSPTNSPGINPNPTESAPGFNDGDNANQDDGDILQQNLWGIVGGSIAGLLVLAIIIAFIVWRMAKNREDSTTPSESGGSDILLGENDETFVGDVNTIFTLSSDLTQKEA